MKSGKTTSKLKEVERALKLMPMVWKKFELQFKEEMRFSKKIFGPTIKEILKYRLSK